MGSERALQLSTHHPCDRAVLITDVSVHASTHHRCNRACQYTLSKSYSRRSKYSTGGNAHTHYSWLQARSHMPMLTTSETQACLRLSKVISLLPEETCLERGDTSRAV
eukprot:6107050-Amphidinium_carterae.1